MMKKIIILSVFAILFTFTFPAKTYALFLDDFYGPHCLFTDCDSYERSRTRNVTNNTTNNTNSNNVNSNINSNISYNNTPNYNYDDYDYDNLSASCYSNPTTGEVGDRIYWRSSVHGGDGNYNITWSGTNGLDGNGDSVTKRYTTPGTKNASITVRSAGQTISRNCNSVQIYDDYDDDYYNDYDYDDDYYDNNLSVSCSVNTSFAPAGTRVVWDAQVYGGIGSYRYEWTGTDNFRGYSRSQDFSYTSPGPKYASVTVHSGNRRMTRQCSNFVTVGVPIYTPQYPTYPTYTAPIVKKAVVKQVEVKKEVKEDENKEMSASSVFSLNNVPWGWVAVLIIIVLLATVIYLIFNRNKI
ncbi:MAG TPA: hypothetical protein VJI66_01605 [Candidatus Paceibacterota bacterium]